MKRLFPVITESDKELMSIMPSVPPGLWFGLSSTVIKWNILTSLRKSVSRIGKMETDERIQQVQVQCVFQ